jgi:hypothetical protein
MKISYGVTVCNEVEEIKRLVNFLLEHKREEDQIVVLMDLEKSDFYEKIPEKEIKLLGQCLLLGLGQPICQLQISKEISRVSSTLQETH